jgi:hypothetical protein
MWKQLRFGLLILESREHGSAGDCNCSGGD